MQFAGLVESGSLNQRAQFVAPAGATLSVRRKRGVNAWSAWGTPLTVGEDDPTNCPGAFSLLMNQDMTITTGKLFEQMSFYVSDGAGWFDIVTVVIVANNLPANVKQIIGKTLTAGGSPDLSPIGFI